MKSNNLRILKHFSVGIVMSLAGMASIANASANDKSEDRPISALGQATGLELYDSDASDRCILGAQQIRVTANGVTSEGILKLELYAEEDFFKSKGKLRRLRVPAAHAVAGPICVNVPVAGEYAIVGYHDIDGNRKLKKAWNFKPKEPYGLSNNPEITKLRIPKWSETKFPVGLAGADVTINFIDLDADD